MGSLKVHAMQIAEDKLRELGIAHAPIKGFLEEPGISGREVNLGDPPGAYYLLGIDVPYPKPGTRDRIQVMFLQCPENAAQIAEQIGWKLEKLEVLEPVDPEGENPHISGVPAAIFVPHA